MLRPRLPRSPLGRRRAWAFGISLLVHAAAGWLLLRGSPAIPWRSPEPAPLEIEIVSRAAPVLPATGSPAPASSPRSPATEAGEPAPGKRRPPRRSSPGASPPPSAETAAAPASGDSTLDMRFAPPGRDILPSLDTIDRLTRQGVIAPPDPRAASASKPRGPTFSERLAARVRDDIARDNVEAGRVHPQVFDYMRDARRDFAPDPEAFDDDPRAPNTFGRTLRQWGRWLGETGGRRLAEERRLLREHHAARRGEPDLRGKYEDRAQEDVAQAAEPIGCRVCLVLRPGKPPEVVLGESSGNTALDRAALAALDRAARKRPPEEAAKAQRSCYRFQATLLRLPPLPIAGCGPDGKGGLQCFYPGRKLLRTSVTLESVDYEGG